MPEQARRFGGPDDGGKLRQVLFFGEKGAGERRKNR
jgi:hypothetical protein